MGVMRDITERKRAETQLKNSEQRYRNIIQTSMDCFWLIDTEEHILDVNDAYCQLSGYAREEQLKMRSGMWKRRHSGGDGAAFADARDERL